jgi:hypothetical protein
MEDTLRNIKSLFAANKNRVDLAQFKAGMAYSPKSEQQV